MARIFISYRREDAKWVAGRMYDRLTEMLDKENVFLDVSDIDPGDDFVESVKQIVGSCDVLLAVIGPSWLGAKDATGALRLQNTDDLVRVEIATALRRDIRVIPILVDNVPMPPANALPDDLQALTRRNGKEVGFSRFHADLDSLIKVLRAVLGVSGSADSSVPTDVDSDAEESADVTDKDVNTVLPMTISLEIHGGEVTPLIAKGAGLPAEQSMVMSTADDNQAVATVHLVWGEAKSASDNLSIGRFELEDLQLAPKGVPRIEVTATVDESLIMTVKAEDQATGRSEILDSVDLSQIEIPDHMLAELEEKPIQRESPRDAGFSDMFADVFGDIFGKRGKKKAGNSQPSLDVHTSAQITSSEAKSGVEIEVNNAEGRTLRCKVPAGTKDGSVLRLIGQGGRRGEDTGDLYVKIKVG